MIIDYNNIILFGIAVLNAFAAFAAWQTRKDAAEIKVHTNSMKDALVGAREEVARLAGLEAGRTEADKNAAERAKGALQAQMTQAVDTVIKENGNHTEAMPVEVINTEKPVPVKITKEAVNQVKDAVIAAKRQTSRRKAKRK